MKSYCSEIVQCVTGTGVDRLYFGSGIKLIVETSKYFLEKVELGLVTIYS